MQLVGEVWGFRPSPGPRLLRAARRPRRAAVLDVAQRLRRARDDADRRDAGRRRRRLRLLPGQCDLLAELHLRRHRAAGRGRGRPADPARAPAPPARGRRPVRAAEAAAAARCCRARSASSPASAARRATTCSPACAAAAGRGRLVWAFAPVQDRHAAPADRRRAAGAGRDRAGRGRDRRARRRLARRPVRVLRRGAVPHGRAAARAGDLVRRTPHRPHADRRRRRGLLLDADARRRGRGAGSTAGRRAATSPRSHAGSHGHGRRAVVDRARALGHLSRAPAQHVRRHRRHLHQLLRELRASARRARERGRSRAGRPSAASLQRTAARAQGSDAATRAASSSG